MVFKRRFPFLFLLFLLALHFHFGVGEKEIKLQKDASQVLHGLRLLKQEPFH